MFCFVCFVTRKWFALVLSSYALCLHQYPMSTHGSPFVLLLPTTNQLSLSLSPRSSPYDCHICQVRVFTLFNTHTKGMRSPSDIYFSSLASAICRTQNLTDGDDQALLASVCLARQSLRRYGGVAWWVTTLSFHPVMIRDPLYKRYHQKRGLLIS